MTNQKVLVVDDEEDIPELLIYFPPSRPLGARQLILELLTN
jgi:hypothetical protein